MVSSVISYAKTGFILCAAFALWLVGEADAQTPRIGSDVPPSLGGSAVALSEATSAASRMIAPTVVAVNVPPDEISLRRWRYYEEYTGRERREEKRRHTRLTSSGVFLTSDGYVLTNHHVIDNVHPDSIRVIVANGDTYRAVLVGSDELTDLAVLRVYGEGFPVPYIANSDSVAVGEWVLAVGNPMALRSTITAGIISAVGRGTKLDGEEDDRSIHNYLQFDAAVNPGNSGGGLFDMRGRLIGIVSALWSASGYFTGYGLAIPAKLARAVAEDLIEDGHIDRVTLGISASDVADTTARTLRMKSSGGALVDYVDSSSAAGRAGLRPRDVIVAFDDRPISTARELQMLLAELRGDATVPMRIWRAGREETLLAALTHERRGDSLNATPTAALDVSVSEVTPQLAERERLPSAKGVVIEDLDPYGSAAHAGVLRGDIVMWVDEDPVSAPPVLQRVIGLRRPGDRVRLQIWRGGEEITLHAILGQAPHDNRAR
jgi:S1-C subfamily serine protease